MLHCMHTQMHTSSHSCLACVHVQTISHAHCLIQNACAMQSDSLHLLFWARSRVRTRTRIWTRVRSRVRTTIRTRVRTGTRVQVATNLGQVQGKGQDCRAAPRCGAAALYDPGPGLDPDLVQVQGQSGMVLGVCGRHFRRIFEELLEFEKKSKMKD